MANRSRVLIVGATGFIGRRFVKASLALGHPTFVLVRPEVLDVEKVHMLLSFKQQGAKLLEGSFNDRKSLVAALKQVDVVISAVAGNHLRHHILEQLKLVEAIVEAGNIKRFLPSEFGTDPDRMEHALPPGNIIFLDKIKVRRAIEAAGIPHTYVSANIFAGYGAVGLEQIGRLLPPRDKVIIYGDGSVKEFQNPTWYQSEVQKISVAYANSDVRLKAIDTTCVSLLWPNQRVLIVGATGYIGRWFVKASLALGHPTFVLVRPEIVLDVEKVHMLLPFKQQGAKLLEGSFDDRKSLVAALKQVDVVVCAVAGNLQRDHILKQLKLVEAIVEAGNIKRFLPSEFGMDPDRMEHALPPGNIIFPDKIKVRRAIEAAGIPHTYVSANIFAGHGAVGLGQLDRLLPPRDKVIIYGDGSAKAVWVDEDDVGTYTIKTIDDPRTLNKTVYIRPPHNILSQKELVEKWEQVTGKTLEKTYISDAFFIGDLYNFEIGPNARESSELYPEVRYTTMDSYMKRYV